jgi:hypothetical protein
VLSDTAATMARTSLYFVLFLCGCFRKLDDVQDQGSQLPTISLSIRDTSGAVWDAESCPRVARFTLSFAESLPRDAARQLFLLRAAPSDATLTDLGSGKRSKSLEALLVPLTIEAQDQSLLAYTTSALEPTAHYTLVWAQAQAALQLPIVISGSPAAGSQLVQSLPASLDARVPPNLARALLRFDGYVRGDAGTLVQLFDADGARLDTSNQLLPCNSFGLGPGDCISIVPEAELRPARRHRIVLAKGLSDATTAPLPGAEITFDTAPDRDLAAPRFSPLDCARDETRHGSLCVLVSDEQVAVRARSDENGLLELATPPDVHATLASAGEYSLQAPLVTSTRALLVLRDMAGNRTSLEMELAPLTDLAKVSIDEVRADPLGPEPSQEYVELLNFGDQPVSIMGFTLTDDPYAEGAHISDEQQLAPGERVLVVAPDFDVQDEADGAPAGAYQDVLGGVRVARLSSALSLRNDGSQLLLRDGQGRRLSAAPALAPAKPGQCIERVVAESSTSARRRPLGFVSTSCSPGFGSDGG